MGSTVSWLPQQPLCVSSISKQGQLVLQDVRLLGRPLLQQQLDGPVYDAVWMASGVNTGSSADGLAGGSGGVLQEQQLVVVGRDNCLRVYTLDAAALQQGGDTRGVLVGCCTARNVQGFGWCMWWSGCPSTPCCSVDGTRHLCTQ
jgi:hypothetical protein